MRVTDFAWVLVALLCTIIIIFLWEIRNQLRSIATSVSHLQDVSEYSETIDENVDAIFHRVKLISESKLLKSYRDRSSTLSPCYVCTVTE